MQWFGKAFGSILGFAAGGPIGSLLGLALGHRFDEGGGFAFARAGSAQQVSQLFFEVTFEVMGQVAKVDGRVSEDEVRVARQIMHGMRLSNEQVKWAIDAFTRGKEPNYPLAERLGRLTQQIGGRGVLARAFMQIQLQAAIGSGAIGNDKRQLLWRVASALNVSRAEVAQIEAFVRGYAAGGKPDEGVTLEDAYRVLGVASDASNDDVKRAYRRLMNQHHPDKLVARGLPKSMVGVAEQKTLEIRGAYEKIKARRGMR
jgi:DnaJ like chaperone protein